MNSRRLVFTFVVGNVVASSLPLHAAWDANHLKRRQNSKRTACATAVILLGAGYLLKSSDSTIAPIGNSARGLPDKTSSSIELGSEHSHDVVKIEIPDENQFEKAPTLMQIYGSWAKAASGTVNSDSVVESHERETALLERMRYWKTREVSIEKISDEDRRARLLEAIRDLLIVEHMGPHRSNAIIPVRPEDLDISPQASSGGHQASQYSIYLNEPYQLHREAYFEIGRKMVSAMKPGEWQSSESPLRFKANEMFEKFADALSNHKANTEDIEENILELWSRESAAGLNLSLPSFIQIDLLPPETPGGHSVAILRALVLKNSIERNHELISVDPYSLEVGLTRLTVKSTDGRVLTVQEKDFRFTAVVDIPQ